MSRYAHAQASPGQPTFEGDEQFVAMDMETKKWLLPPGHVHYAQNKRLATGTGAKRGGSILPHFANVVAFGAIFGSYVFSNPNGDKVMLIAAPSVVWKITDGGYPTAIALPAGVTLSGAIEFTQDFAKVKLHRGPALPALVWDGTSTGTFELAVKGRPDVTTTELVPKTDWSLHFGDRNIFPVSRDEFGASDINQPNDWDPLSQIFRANAGSADVLTGIFPYAHSNLIIGKKQSIDVFKNFTGNLAGISAQVVTSALGVYARRTWQMIGPDGIFLSHRGVFMLSQVDQDRLQTSPIPVAAYKDDKGKLIDPIAPILRRINWAYADKAVAGLDGPYYVLAVPIDGSKVNNALLYLNTVSGRWESLDLFDPRAHMQIDNLLVFDFRGEQRLYTTNHLTKSIHLLNEGKFDETATGRWEIEDILDSRGYATLGWNASVRRDFKRVVIPVATWRPKITCTESTEGTNDNRVIAADLTKDRRKYDTFGKKPFVVSNVNDDALVPGRQDYSVEITGADPPTLGSGATSELYLGSGVPIEAKQESVLGAPGGFSTKCRGRYISYRIRNTQGDCDVLGILVESDGEQRTTRRAA